MTVPERIDTSHDDEQLDCVPVTWYDGLPHLCLRFTFPTALTHQAAQTAVIDWREAFAHVPKHRKISLMWDCSVMVEYDGRAFALWVATIRELRAQIRDVWLISGSSLVRTGATLIGLLTRFEVRTVESEADMLARLTQTEPAGDDV